MRRTTRRRRHRSKPQDGDGRRAAPGRRGGAAVGPAAPPSPPSVPDRDTTGSAGAARHAHPTDARAPAPAPPPLERHGGARGDAAAPRAETLAAVRAERDALRDENKALQDLLTRRNYEVDFLRQQLAANGISVPDSGIEVDLGSVAFGSRDYDVACDAAARRLLPPKLALATEDFRVLSRTRRRTTRWRAS